MQRSDIELVHLRVNWSCFEEGTVYVMPGSKAPLVLSVPLSMHPLEDERSLPFLWRHYGDMLRFHLAFMDAEARLITLGGPAVTFFSLDSNPKHVVVARMKPVCEEVDSDWRLTFEVQYPFMYTHGSVYPVLVIHMGSTMIFSRSMRCPVRFVFDDAVSAVQKPSKDATRRSKDASKVPRRMSARIQDKEKEQAVEQAWEDPLSLLADVALAPDLFVVKGDGVVKE